MSPEPVEPDTPPNRLKTGSLGINTGPALIVSVSTDHDQMSLIHHAIQSLRPETDLSDPNTFITLPFPSPLRTPTERFAIHPRGDTVKRFQYMGRSLFQDLLTAVADPSFLDGSTTLYLCGPSGTGKSHLLAALVCHLVREGERVVFIPDCSALLTDLRGVIRKALLFAFHDNPYLRDEINLANDMDDLVRIVEQRAHHTLYIIVDQRNALDPAGSMDLQDVDKTAAFRTIDSLRAFQRYIFSASANEQSDREHRDKQTEIKALEYRAGLNKVWPHLFNYLISCSPGGGSVLVFSPRRLTTQAF